MSGCAFVYGTYSLELQIGVLSPILVELTTSNEQIDAESVSQGPNASVDVFWLLYNGNTNTDTEYEQTYNREGSAVGKRITIGSITNFFYSADNNTADAVATANGGYVFMNVDSVLWQDSSNWGFTDKLIVKTDKLGPITVTTTEETYNSKYNDYVGHEIVDPSLTANADGSFDLFWNVATSSPGGIIPITWAEYEQVYSATGTPIGSQKTILSSQGSEPYAVGPSDATGTANGGYVFAGVQQDGSLQLLTVQTNTLGPIDVATSASGFSNVSVSSSEDGSFQVFWDGGYEQAYTATGTPIGGSTDIDIGSNFSDATFLPIGIDASEIGPIATNAATVAEQYNFVGVYLNPHSAGTFTAAMAQELSDANLSLVSIYETGKMATTSYYSSNPLQNGTMAGEVAFREAYKDSQPSGSAIYFGIEPGGHDTYGNTTLLNDIETYFEGVAAGFTAEATALKTTTDYAIGVYGSPTTDSTMLADGVADLSWVAASAFHNYNSYTGWSLKQTAIELPGFGTTNGVDCDASQGANFGQWSLPSVA